MRPTFSSGTHGPAICRSTDPAKGTGDSDGQGDLARSGNAPRMPFESSPGVTGVTNSISIRSTAAVSDIKKKIEDALTRHAQVEAQAILRYRSGGEQGIA